MSIILKIDIKIIWRHKFWGDGYFACSIRDTNRETIRKYIEN